MAYHAVIALSLFYITLMIYKYPLIFNRVEPHTETYSKETLLKDVPQSESVSPKIQLADKQDFQKGDCIIAKIERLMSEQKVYKNPNFSLNDLAEAISESRNAISYGLNNSLNKTFYNYINELRIEESKRLLAGETFLHYTIEGIAAEAGFKSMSVFYKFFKDIEGVTPAVYRKKHLNT
jgi:YesN/AraC family two-component response regulator